MLASILHTCDPFAIQFTDSFGIRWYGLSYAVGMLLGWSVLRWLSRTGRTPLSAAQIDNFTTALIVGLLAGGRIGHVLFYEPKLFVAFSSSFPFWGLLEIYRGGMSSHGAMIGIAIACIWFGRSNRLPILHLGDLICFVAPIGLGLGRLANWVNGELPGKPLPSALQAEAPWWSVKYPSDLLTETFWNARSDAQIEALRNAAKSVVHASSDIPQTLHDACYAGNQTVINAVTPLLTAYYPSNFFQAITDGLILPAILVLIWLKPRSSGTIFGAFFVVYGILRVTTEQFRTPDPDIFTVGPVTLPMMLSGAMILVGATVMAVASRSSGPKVGGLLRPRAS
ncbi:MAG: prolipoprotein diacylglyceryl transferase [Phycisphaerae bacterium]|nr:prolipoprotein diacylglyceryl transferase [Phycisphaerae bacterium]